MERAARSSCAFKINTEIRHLQREIRNLQTEMTQLQTGKIKQNLRSLYEKIEKTTV